MTKRMRRSLIAILLTAALWALAALINGCASAPGEGGNSPPPVSTAVASGMTLLIQAPAPPLQVGASAPVNISIENAANLWAISLKLTFDPAIVECASQEAGTIPKPEIVARNACAAAGAEYIVTQKAPSDPASGGGTVVRFNLKCKAAGTSPLRLENVKLVDRDGQSLSNTFATSQIVCAGR